MIRFTSFVKPPFPYWVWRRVIPNIDYEHTVEVTGQQWMRTPSWHLIPTLAFVWAPCYPTIDFVFAFWIMTAFNSMFLFDIYICTYWYGYLCSVLKHNFEDFYLRERGWDVKRISKGHVKFIWNTFAIIKVTKIILLHLKCTCKLIHQSLYVYVICRLQRMFAILKFTANITEILTWYR
jgi:hypothetical protein